MDFARAYYHWFHLIQPAPLPEAHDRWLTARDLSARQARGLGRSQGLAYMSKPQALAEYERCLLSAPKPSTVPARTTAPAPASTSNTTVTSRARRASKHRLRYTHVAPWHFLYFLPLPQWQRSLRPGSAALRTVSTRGPMLRQSSRRS
jgi:haloacetate dehalogenase